MARSSQVVVAWLEVTVLIAALIAVSMARAATIAIGPATAEIVGAGGNDVGAGGQWHVLKCQTVSEGRSAMHEIFKKRHCVRSFQSRNVSRGDLQAIIAAADSAPSAGGLKSREVLVVSDDETKKRLVQAALGQEFVAQAPVVLVFWAVPSRSASKYGERGRDFFSLQDATIAASFAWLQAVASGLSACWVGAFDDDAVKSIFRNHIGSDWRPIALLPVGYAAE